MERSFRNLWSLSYWRGPLTFMEVWRLSPYPLIHHCSPFRLVDQITNERTPCIRVLLERLEFLQLIKKLSSFYGTQRFITAFTKACQLSPSWARSTQFMSPHPTYWRSILILSSQLRLSLPNSLFTSGLPTKTLLSPIRATSPARLFLLHLITRIFGEDNKP